MTTVDVAPAEAPPARRPAWRPVLAVAAAQAALLLALNGRYGYHRDELYFRLLGQHPAWGYADQGPLTPLLGRASTLLFGDTLWALRLPATICAVLATVLMAPIVRDLGGRAAAQTLAAAAIGFSSFGLLGGHMLVTATPDIPLWLLALWATVRALRGDPRWWLLVGAAAGVATYNKLLVALLGIGLAAGIAAAGPRRVLRERWLWLGVGVTLVLAAPNLLYQIGNGWPEIEMAHAISRYKGGDDRVMFLPFHVLLIGITMVPVWVAGVRRLWRDREVRAVPVAYLTVCVLVFVTGGQVYYPVAFAMYALAAGFPSAVEWAGRGRAGVRRALLGAAVAVHLLLSVMITLPVLPVEAEKASPAMALVEPIREQFGWPAFTDAVVAAYRAVPPGPGVAIMATNYGEAGALDRFGAGRLPAVYTPHNGLAPWRPPATVTTVVVPGADCAYLRAFFARCTAAGTVDNGQAIDNEEQGNPISVAADPIGGWPAAWPRLTHFS